MPAPRSGSDDPRATGGELHPRVLLVGPREAMDDAARALLSQDAYDVAVESDGETALEKQRREHFDAIVVDLEAPPFDQGRTFEMLWGRSEGPILVLTGRADANDAIAALEVGAHDYLKKPFHPAELAARVRKLLRLVSWMPRSALEPVLVCEDDLIIDRPSFRVWRRGREIMLSVTEFNLLVALVQGAGTTLSRDELLEKVWSYQFLGQSRLVDMTVVRLRRKIEDDPKHPALILTVKGYGYRFEKARVASARV